MVHTVILNNIVRLEAATAILMGMSILFVYLRWADMRTWSYTLVVLMAFTGVLSNIADATLAELTMEENPIGCYMHAMVSQFMDMATSFWAGVLLKFSCDNKQRSDPLLTPFLVSGHRLQPLRCHRLPTRDRPSF
jgi:Na+-transporting methylmalonyl-CoA/oxaloacetate decarboxylase beta subunit